MDRDKFVSIITTVTLIFAAMVASGGITYVTAYPSPSESLYVEAGVYPGAPSYTIWKDGSTYYAKDAHGHIPSWGESSNFSLLINTAINVGGKTLLTNGSYTLSIPITISKVRVSLSGEGRNTIISVPNNFDDNIIEVTMSSLTAMEVTIENLRILGNKANQAAGNGIYLNNSNRVTMQNLLIESCKENGIFGENGGVHRILNVEIRACGQSGLAIGSTSSDWYIAYTECRTSDLHGIDIQSDSHTITSSRFDENNGTGMYIRGYGFNLIQSCIVDRNNSTGIRTTSSSRYNVISGNWIYMNEDNGILLEGNKTIVCANQIYDNDQSNGNWHGIQISSYYNKISGNICSDKQASATQNWGIIEGTDYNTIIDNTCYDNTAGGIKTVGSNTKCNLCWNDTTWIS